MLRTFHSLEEQHRAALPLQCWGSDGEGMQSSHLRPRASPCMDSVTWKALSNPNHYLICSVEQENIVHLSSLFTWCNLYFYYVGCLCFGTGCPVKLCLPQPWLLSQEKGFYFLTFLKLSIVSVSAFHTSFKPPFVIAWLGLADGFTQNSIWWQTWCVCGYCCDSYN